MSVYEVAEFSVEEMEALEQFAKEHHLKDVNEAIKLLVLKGFEFHGIEVEEDGLEVHSIN